MNVLSEVVFDLVEISFSKDRSRLKSLVILLIIEFFTDLDFNLSAKLLVEIMIPPKDLSLNLMKSSLKYHMILTINKN